VATKNFRLLRV